MLLLYKNVYFLSLFAPEHLILIAFVVLLLFGGKKIPDLMKGMGKGIREFNDAKAGVKRDIENSIEQKEEMEKTSSTTTSSQQ